VGDEVMGVQTGALARRIAVPSAFLARKPRFFDFAEAASVPFPFLVARYALQVVARLRAGERVLILSAAGGIGQALVQVARSLGAEVNATAGSAEKRALLRVLGARVLEPDSDEDPDRRKAFEGLCDFDVIVSGDAGPAMHALLARLGAGGRYIDLCPRASFERPELGTLRLGANRSVSSIDVGAMMQTEPSLVAALLEETAEEALQGALQAIPTTVFTIAQAGRALRYMAQNRHAGRVVIDLAEAESARVRPIEGTSRPLAERGAVVVHGPESVLRSAVVEWMQAQSADEVVEVGSGELAATLVDLVARGRRLAGWIDLAPASSREDAEPGPASVVPEFRVSIARREALDLDPASGRDWGRDWEGRLILDRLRLSLAPDAHSGTSRGRAVQLWVSAEETPERIVEWLAAAILCEVSHDQVVVLDSDELAARLDRAPSPWLAELRRGHEIRDRTQMLRAELGTLSAAERRTTMQRFVLDALAGVLGLSDEQRAAIDFGSQLDSLGLDSLMTMELFMGMGRDLQLQIAADWFASVPSLADIATVLVERLEEAVSTGKGA